MRVGINGLFLDPALSGGIWTYLRNLMRELPSLDPEIHYALYTNRENATAFEMDSSTNVRRIVCPVRTIRRPSRFAYETLILPMQAHLQQVDLLFLPSFSMPIRFGHRTVLTIHDVQHEDIPEHFTSVEHRIFRKIYRQSARSASHIITVSEHARHRITAIYGVSPERITVAHLAADPVYFAPLPWDDIARARSKYGLRDPYILFVGQIHPHKNIDVLVDALVALRETTAPNVRLVLVGPQGTAGAALAERTRREGLKEYVIFTGIVPGADLPALYQGAAVFALPSRYEGFGLPVLEAMASGVPVVTTTATALPEVAGDAALLVEPDDAAGLAGALGRVLDDGALRAELIGRGRERAAQFTWRATAETTLAAFHRGLSSRIR